MTKPTSELNGPQQQWWQWQTRRAFLRHCQLGFGAIALGTMARPAIGRSEAFPQHLSASGAMPETRPLLPRRAKRVIYLHMAGSPSQLELFEDKPELAKRHMQPCPDEILKNQQFAFIKGHPQLLGPQYKFQKYGEGGLTFSELVPEMASCADQWCMARSCVTDQFNHAPAQLYLLTGNARGGYPSFGSWVTYGLGSENENLPSFVVLLSGGNNPSSGKAGWSSGFLPGVYQGVQCRSSGDPILFMANPPGMSRDVRRKSLDLMAQLNQAHLEEFGDPETATRIQQYELAYRMQISAPEIMDISRESAETLAAYGAQPGQSSFANNCLLARRLIEQGVRFVQLFDWGWDVHGTGPHDDLITQLPKKCRETDRSVAALLRDLAQRGMLDDTLVIWGGEFGRTSMNEARDGSKFLGRDHHPHAFTMLFAGGGMKAGFEYGKTDDFGYFVAENKLTVRDIQATLLHTLGLDPYHLSYPFQGLNARWIGPTDEGQVCHALLK